MAGGPGFSLSDSVATLSRHIPGPTDRRAERIKFKALVSVIVLVVGLILLALLGGFGVAAFVVWIAFVVLYVPPWEEAPIVGDYVRPAVLIALIALYPFYWDRGFTIPVLGEWPAVSTGVYMLI